MIIIHIFCNCSFLNFELLVSLHHLKECTGLNVHDIYVGICCVFDGGQTHSCWCVFMILICLDLMWKISANTQMWSNKEKMISQNKELKILLSWQRSKNSNIAQEWTFLPEKHFSDLSDLWWSFLTLKSNVRVKTTCAKAARQAAVSSITR